MTDFHLVSSPSSAASLRISIRDFGLSGKVLCINDELNLGPLLDEHERAAFWRSLVVIGCDDESPLQESSDVYAPWRVLRKSIAAERPSRLLIWGSGSGSDYVLLRMACYWLAEEEVTLWYVPIPAMDEFHNVALHTPEALATFAINAIAITAEERIAMAKEYTDIAARPENLRECDSKGELLFQSMTVHDDFILSCCFDEWVPAARVVGDVMGRGDPRNPLSDRFVAFRLQHLIEKGLVEVDGSRKTLRDYRVRRCYEVGTKK